MRRRVTTGVWVAAALFLSIAAVVFGLSRLMSGGLGSPGGGDVVGFIRIQGGIFDAKDTLASLDKLRRNPRVKSLLLRIDSPGGAVGPTQEIYEEIQRFRRSGRKVVASLGSVAASGGYYLASAADRIYAYPGTITGSIGVVVVLPNAQEMLGKVGIKFNVIKSAPHKDMGSPFRKMTKDDRAIFQRLIDDTYRQFVKAVAAGRGIPMKKALKIADGSVYSGERAKELGLVDRLGSQWDATLEAGRFARIVGEPKLLEIPSRGRFWGLLNRTFTGWFGGAPYWGGSPALLQYMWR